MNWIKIGNTRIDIDDLRAFSVDRLSLFFHFGKADFVEVVVGPDEIDNIVAYLDDILEVTKNFKISNTAGFRSYNKTV